MGTETQLSDEDRAKLEVLRKIANDAFGAFDRGEGTKVPLGGARDYLRGLVVKNRKRYQQSESEID